MRIRAAADDDADPTRGLDRRSSLRSRRITLNCRVATEIHRVLHRPSNAERFHAPQRRLGRIVDVSQRPAERSDRDFTIHALEHIENLRRGRIVSAMPRVAAQRAMS